MPPVITGMTEEQAEEARRSDRPLLVYIYPDPASEREDDPRVAIEEDRAFRDEGVVVGARFFDCVRIHKDDARADPALKRYSGTAPCLVLVRPNLAPEKCLRGRFKADRVFAAMHDTLEMDYENCLRQILKEQEEIADALAEVYQRQADLDEIDRKIADDKGTSRRAQLEEKRKALAEDVRTAEEQLKTKENALYELKRKSAS
ncbi:MAG TPA: hypothetical protein VFY93_02010 [Planctomycetota bacterium]|nr:hypothetical protein [Planctomycetota bacterium]